MFIQELRGVRPALRASAASLVAGYAARYQNPASKTLYGVNGLDSAQVLTVYGVATRGNSEGLTLLLSLPDNSNNSVKSDLCYIGSSYLSSSGGVYGLGLNTYTDAFTAANLALPQGQAFQYTARFYSAHPEQFSLRINGQPQTLHFGAGNGGQHAVRYFSQLFCLGGDNSNDNLNWVGSYPDTVLYLSATDAATDVQNEAYLMGLYNITA